MTGPIIPLWSGGVPIEVLARRIMDDDGEPEIERALSAEVLRLRAWLELIGGGFEDPHASGYARAALRGEPPPTP